MELVTIYANITVPIYNDGVAEGDEGFVVLLGVVEDDLDRRDIGFVDILTPTVLVRLREGGM